MAWRAMELELRGMDTQHLRLLHRLKKGVMSPQSAPAAMARDGVMPSRRAQEVFALIEQILLREGFAKLTVSEVAERIGCSKRTIYELAPSKNELVTSIIGAFFHDIRVAGHAAASEERDPAQQIYVYLQAGVKAASRLSAQAVADIDQWKPTRGIWREHVNLRVQGLRSLLEAGIAHGAFRDVNPHFVAEIVFAGLDRLRQPDFYRQTRISTSAAFQEYYRILLTGLVVTRDPN